MTFRVINTNVYYEQWLEEMPPLDGKVVAITGTTSGTGYWAAVFTLRKKAKALLLLNRESSRSEEALKKLQAEKETAGSTTELIPVACDLMDFESVRAAASKVNEVCKELGGLNVLANNAGIMMFPDNRTKDGFEVQMQTNHLSHFLLTKLVFPSFDLALENGGEVRICQQASAARHLVKTDHQEKYFEKGEKGTLGGDGARAKMQRYHQTKLANMTFALGLHKKLMEKGYDVEKIKSVVAEPGVATTELAGTMLDNDSGFSKNFMIFIRTLLKPFIKAQSAADGSLPLVHACFAEEVFSGDFFLPHKMTHGKPFRSISKGELSGGKASREKPSLNEKNQEMCWRKSEELFGNFFEFSSKM